MGGVDLWAVDVFLLNIAGNPGEGVSILRESIYLYNSSRPAVSLAASQDVQQCRLSCMHTHVEAIATAQLACCLHPLQDEFYAFRQSDCRLRLQHVTCQTEEAAGNSSSMLFPGSKHE